MKKSILILAIMVVFTTVLTAQSTSYRRYHSFDTKVRVTTTDKSVTTTQKPMSVTITEHNDDIVITIWDPNASSYTTYIGYLGDAWDNNLYVITSKDKHITITDFKSIEIVSTDKNGKTKTILYK